MAKDDGGNIKWVIGAVLVPILAACIGAGVFQVKAGCLPFLCGNPGTGSSNPGTGGVDLTKPASVFLSRTSGPGGSTVNVSGEGFAAHEEIVIIFHNEEIGRTQANGDGKFSNVTVTIPTSFSKFAPQKFEISANGRTSIKFAQASFTISG